MCQPSLTTPDSFPVPGTVTWTVLNILKAVGFSILSLIVVTGNLMVLLVLAKQARSLSPSFPTHFVTSLAVADILVGVVVIPINGTVSIIRNWPFGQVVCEILSGVDIVSIAASIMFLSAIAADRYAGVHHPLAYRNRMTRRMKAGLVVGIWTLVLLVCLSTILFWSQESRAECDDSFEYDRAMPACLAGAFCIPLSIILVVHWKIYRTLARRKGEGSDRADLRRHGGAEMASERKTVLAFVLTAFLVCWLPYITMLALTAVGLEFGARRDLHGIFIWLGYFNSCLNPIIYLLTNKSLAKAFEKFWFCCHNKT